MEANQTERCFYRTECSALSRQWRSPAYRWGPRSPDSGSALLRRYWEGLACYLNVKLDFDLCIRCQGQVLFSTHRLIRLGRFFSYILAGTDWTGIVVWVIMSLCCVNWGIWSSCQLWLKKDSFSIFFLFHAVMSYSFLLLYASSLHVLVCLRLAVCCQCVCTCQWAPSERTHQPSAHPVDHTVLPSLLATRLVPAAGCYLSVRAPWFLPVGVRWLSCVMCIQEPSSSWFSFASPSRPSPPVLLGCNVRERPCCRKALVQIPVHSPPNGNGSLKQGRLERVESQWLITGCAVTRGNSEDPVGGEQGKRERDRKETERKEREKKR